MNSITLLGRVGSIDSRATGSGDIIAPFTLATSTTRKGNTRTEWHRCTAFGKLAEVITNHVNVGDQVLVVGEMRYSKYHDKDGVERYSAQVAVQAFEFAAKKREEAT